MINKKILINILYIFILYYYLFFNFLIASSINNGNVNLYKKKIFIKILNNFIKNDYKNSLIYINKLKFCLLNKNEYKIFLIYKIFNYFKLNKFKLMNINLNLYLKLYYYDFDNIDFLLYIKTLSIEKSSIYSYLIIFKRNFYQNIKNMNLSKILLKKIIVNYPNSYFYDLSKYKFLIINYKISKINFNIIKYYFNKKLYISVIYRSIDFLDEFPKSIFTDNIKYFLEESINKVIKK